ncbi:recombination regulator RecX [Streptomyces sp. NPDC048419]|uniref:recombination regulator RecX n=1 Tax=Streptomyces sp. NPDC048419 TaxID=3365547 RepID=UPI00370FFA10
MTRRTDWAEYAYQDAAAERNGGDDGGSAEPDRDVYGEAAGHGAEGGHGRATPYGAGGSYGADGPFGDDGSYSDGPGGGEWREDGAPEGFGSSRGRSRRGGGARGADGSRGRRRRRRDEASDQDGGSSSSSRAEQEESSGDPVERAKAICLRLLTGTPRTRKQLADALRKREIPDEVAQEVLSRFEEVGLINDSAFAEAWVESRHHGRGLARRALAQELRTKGVDSTLIDEAVSQLDSEQEEATARDLVARKLRATRGLDRDKRLRRLAGMLARKGYPQGMALRVVRQALEEEGEDTEFLGDEGF